MPAGLLRACTTPWCPGLAEHGRCDNCTRGAERRRGSASSRGYNAVWRAFREAFFTLLVSLGIAPVCGAHLPNGPQTSHSRCQAAGLMVFVSEDGTSLHLDHEPPLRDNERTNMAAVCDETRIQLLCASCHAAKEGR